MPYFVLFFCFLVTLPGLGRAEFSPQQQAWLNAQEQITVGVMQDWPPFSFPTGARQVGLSIDLLELVNQKLQNKIVIRPGLWDQIYKDTQSGELDAILDITPSKKRLPFFHFTSPYFSFPHVIVAQKRGPKFLNERDLNGYKLGLEKGFYNVQYFRENFPEVQIVEYPGTSQALEAVGRGEVDAYAGNRAVATYLIQRQVMVNLSVHSELNQKKVQLALGTNSRSPQLRDIFEEALHQITEQQRAEILNKWVRYKAETGGQPFSLSKDQREWLRNHSIFHLGIDREWPPFEFLDEHNHYRGISADIMRLFSKQLGIQFVPETTLSWPEVIEKAKQRKVDLLPAVTKTAKRSEYLNFSEPYVSFPVVIAGQRTTGFISGVADLADKRVGVVKGYVTQEYLNRDFPDLDLSLFASVEAGLQGLQDREIDVFIDNLAAINHVVFNHGIDGIKVISPTKYNFDLRIGVRKDWPELIPILNQSLRTLSAQEKRTIVNSWVAMKYQTGHDLKSIFSWAFPLLLATGFVIWVILRTNRKLSAEIEAKQRIQEELTKNQKQFQAFLDFSPTALYLKDSKGRYLMVNNFWGELFNQAGVDVLGKGDIALFGPVCGEPKLEHSLKVLETAEVQQWEERSPDGSGGRNLLVHEFPILGPQGKPIEVGGIALDITLRKETAAKVNTLYNRLNEAQEIALIGSWEYDHLANEVWASDSAYKILGKQEGEGDVGFTELISFATPFDRTEFETNYHRAMVEEQSFGFDYNVRKRDQSIMTLHMTGKPERDEQGTFIRIRGSIQDITEQVKAQRNLENAKKAAEAANQKLLELDQLKSMFIASMSHELRTPLNSIIGFTSVLLTGMSGPLLDKQKNQLTRVNRSAKHLLNLITDVIDISKIEAGRIEVYPEEIDLDSLIKDVMETLEGQAKAQGLGMFRRGHTGLILYTDQKRLFQSLLNLVSNAVKYTETGQVEVSVVDLSNLVRIEVKDTGIGISESDLPRLFEAFERFESELKVKAGGTGLGLYLTKRIANDLLKGALEVVTEQNQGSIFSLTLPKRLAEESKKK